MRRTHVPFKIPYKGDSGFQEYWHTAPVLPAFQNPRFNGFGLSPSLQITVLCWLPMAVDYIAFRPTAAANLRAGSLVSAGPVI